MAPSLPTLEDRSWHHTWRLHDGLWNETGVRTHLNTTGKALSGPLASMTMGLKPNATRPQANRALSPLFLTLMWTWLSPLPCWTLVSLYV